MNKPITKKLQFTEADLKHVVTQSALPLNKAVIDMHCRVCNNKALIVVDKKEEKRVTYCPFCG